MSGNFKMDDYVPVNERIDAFYATYPEGSLSSEIIELSASRVTVKAYAHRTPDDPRPGTGHSSLDIPGSTPYTRGSEVENAETSAWGRAIAALGFEVKRGIASAEEVRNKQPQAPAREAAVSGAGRARPVPVPRPADEPVPPQDSGGAGDYEPSPFDDVVVDPVTGDAIAAAVGGERLPDKPAYVVKAERKALAAEMVVGEPCPEHGDVVIEGKFGPYCPNRDYKERVGKFHSAKRRAA